MKKLIFLISLIWVVSAHAERIVVYDSTTSAVISSFWGDPIVSENRIVGVNKILVIDEFNNNLVTILDLLNREIPEKFWLVVTDTVREMIQTEKDSVDLGIANADTLQQKTDSKDTVEDHLISRAHAEIIMREINLLRSWTRDFKDETVLATSLGDFQTRVATLPTLTDRTNQQLKNAVKSEIDNLNIQSSGIVSRCGGALWIPGLFGLILGVKKWLKKLYRYFV